MFTSFIFDDSLGGFGLRCFTVEVEQVESLQERYFLEDSLGFAFGAAVRGWYENQLGQALTEVLGRYGFVVPQLSVIRVVQSNRPKFRTTYSGDVRRPSPPSGG